MKQKTKTARRKARQVAALAALQRVYPARGFIRHGNTVIQLKLGYMDQITKQRLVEAYMRLPESSR